MYLKLFLLWLILFFPLLMKGQEYGIYKKYITNGNDAAFGAIEVKDGFIFGGYTNTDIDPLFALEPRCSYLVKVDSLGNKIWEKYYRFDGENSGTGFDYDQNYYRINALIRSQDGNVLCFGSKKIMDLLIPIVIKVNTSGDTLWTYNAPIDTTEVFEDIYPVQGIEDAEGNILILCITSPLNSRKFRHSNILIKLSADGKLLWRKKINIKYRLFKRFEHLKNNNQYVLFGGIYFHESYQPPLPVSDTASAIVLDSNGVFLKEKILYADPSPDLGLGDYIFFQTKPTNTGIVVGLENNTRRERTFISFDENLDTIETKTFDNSNYQSTSLAKTYNGYKYYTEHETVFTDSLYTPIFTFQKGNFNDYFLVTVAEKCQFHSGAFAVGYIENKDAMSYPVEPNSSDVIFIKTNSQGYYSNSSNHSERVRIFPNPSHDYIYISYNLATSGEFSLILYDCTGRIVMEIAKGAKNSGGYLSQVDLSTLNSGIYFIQLTNEGKTSFEKLVID